MKKFVALVLVLVSVLSMVCGACAECYFCKDYDFTGVNVVVRYGMIVELDEDTWTMVIETEDGNLWECEVDDDWWTGDIVEVIFDGMNTQEVEDDKIICVHYLYSVEVEG